MIDEVERCDGCKIAKRAVICLLRSGHFDFNVAVLCLKCMKIYSLEDDFL